MYPSPLRYTGFLRKWKGERQGVCIVHLARYLLGSPLWEGGGNVAHSAQLSVHNDKISTYNTVRTITLTATDLIDNAVLIQQLGLGSKIDQYSSFPVNGFFISSKVL